MDIRVTLIIFFLAFITVDSHAQFWKKKRKARPETSARQPNSLNPGENPAAERGAFAPKESRRESRKASASASRGPTYGLVEEYYERMEAVAKARKKAARLMKKPQYSNPLYFGHKRPPKKHKPSKMKYCKVCGIRH